MTDPATALAASDLDADGTPELVAAIPDAHAIAVIDAAAATVRKYAAGANPALFAVGDVDGDERLDVVVLDAPSGLQVLRGTGDGRLREAVAESAGSELQVGGIDLADHDGDGDLDAFTHAGQDHVLVHRNDGDGRFSTPIALPLPAPLEGRGLAVGPVADSGFVGVSVPSSRGFDVWFGKGSVWLGRLGRALESASTWIGASTDAGLLVGGIGFLYRFAYRAAGSALEVWRSEDVQGDIFTTSVTTGHLDGNVLLDVAVFDDDRLTLLRGRADRGLEPIASLELDLDLASWPVTLAIADMTGDGRPDILISDITTAWLVQATVDGGYALRSPYMHKEWASQLVPVRTGANEPAAVLVIPTSESGQPGGRGCSLLRFGEDGAVTEAIDLLGLQVVFGGAAVDFDEDGIDELLLAYHGSSTTLLAHMSPEGGTYVADATHDLQALTGGSVGGIREFAFAVGDLDEDGRAEAVVASSKAVVAVSGLVEGAPVATITPDIAQPRHLRDLDGDGHLDAATALSYGSFLYHRGRGDRTFEPEPITVDFVDGVAMALASGPGAQFDLVHVSRTEIATHLMRSVVRPVLGGGAWFHGPVDELIAADVDSDGSDDVVLLSRALAGGVGVWWGGQDEPLARIDAHVPGRPIRGLAVADLDGDDALEAIAVDAAGVIEAYAFAPRQQVAPIRLAEIGAEVQQLAVADVDGDERMDLVGLLPSSDGSMRVAVARGGAALQFAAFADVAEVASNTHATLELGDVGGDGDVDILVRAQDARESALVLAEAPGVWAEPAVVPGLAAMFGPADAVGRVELVTQEGTSIYRYPAGQLDERVLLLQSDELEGALLQGVADLDGEGPYDLTVLDEEGTHVWLRRDDEVVRAPLCDRRLYSHAFADVDGDGRRDLIGVNAGALFVRRTRP
ncbi:FG-GAP repeat domain-containing protein [Nannocystis pusilla]|uniref:FG-GAP repeat domain-containing protein n=1 Tax=Nannocystis pusilla TaxID=889268 RepID=UPI003DA29B68